MSNSNFYFSVKYILKAFSFFLISTAVFFVLINSPLLHKFNYLFFRAIFLIASSIVLTAYVFRVLNNFFKLSVKDIVLFSVVSFSINWFVYGLIPFNVSRSNSAILIGYLNSRNGDFSTKEQIEVALQTVYFEKYKAVDVRLNEQVFNGVVERVDDRYRLTSYGVRQVNFLNYISNFYGVKNNFLDADLYKEDHE